MKKVSAIPNTILLNSLRDSGYTETMAICDIIDNSIDAKAKNIDITIGSKSKKVTSIVIEDDGIGMNRSTLIQALTLGSNVIRKTSSLGHYGMGLKTAGLSIAKEIKVLTKKSNKDGAYEGIFDLDSMLASNTFNISIDKSTKRSLGTIITLNNVDKLTSTTANSYKNHLKNTISTVFSKLLDKINITINGTLVVANDIFLESLSTNYNVDINGVKQSPYDIEFDINGKKIKKKVKIDLWKMPLSANPKDPYSQKNQGFYIFRNGRLIASHLDLDIYTKIPDMNYFRGAIYFDNMDDVKDAIGLNFSKQGVNFNQSLKNTLRWKLRAPLKRMQQDIQNEKALLSIKNTSLEDFISRQLSKIFKKGINWNLGIFNGQNALSNTTGTYKRPKRKPQPITSGPNKNTNPVIKATKVRTPGKPSPSKSKPPAPNTPSKNAKQPMQNGATTSIVIEKLPLGKNDIFWKFEDMTSGAIKIILNIDHDFYKKEYLPAPKNVKIALLKSYIATGRGMLRAGLVSEDTEDNMNEMFTSFGDDYRKYI